MVKRLFDLVLSALALLVLAPLLLCLALWVMLDSPGGAFFRQTRMGRAGKPFRIYKFRTMCVGAEAFGPAITAQADARITRAGHWLRRTKLDELPQFLNVLIGDMSIVGPRPEVPRYVDLYPAAARSIVFSVRPGITDTASIKFRNESHLLGQGNDPERIYVEQILPVKLQHAVHYAGHHSLWGDLKIIAHTAAALWHSPSQADMGPKDGT